MSELSPRQMMDVFERLVEKSVSGGRFSDHDSDCYQILRDNFINAYVERDALRFDQETLKYRLNLMETARDAWIETSNLNGELAQQREKLAIKNAVERDALVKKLEVSKEWLSLALREDEFSEYVAEIERIGKESGVNLTVGEEDGKV
jgi:uncharacterized protein YqgV (UPF0045/DUF77 family)